jgi:hypothetical protein
LFGTGGPIEEAQTILDDHLVKSQAIAASPFSKPFHSRILPWETKLRRFQACVPALVVSHVRTYSAARVLPSAAKIPVQNAVQQLDVALCVINSHGAGDT